MSDQTNIDIEPEDDFMDQRPIIWRFLGRPHVVDEHIRDAMYAAANDMSIGILGHPNPHAILCRDPDGELAIVADGNVEDVIQLLRDATAWLEGGGRHESYEERTEEGMTAQSLRTSASLLKLSIAYQKRAMSNLSVLEMKFEREWQEQRKDLGE